MFDLLRKLFAENKEDIKEIEEKVQCSYRANCSHIQGLKEEYAKQVCKACDDMRYNRLPKPKSSGPPQFTDEEKIRMILEG